VALTPGEWWLLDLFCRAGGAARGYELAGFQVLGVDVEPQPDYPGLFLQADALEVLALLVTGRALPTGHVLGDFAAVHSSPPCQRHSKMTKQHARQLEHPDLLDPTRALLERTGLPWVIENVPGAPLRDPLVLCGSQFGLGAWFEGEWRQLRRHRLFESNVTLLAPGPCRHSGQTIGVYGNPGGSSRRDSIRFPGAEQWREAMGIDWTSAKNVAQAIPPAYSRWLGRQLGSAVILLQQPTEGASRATVA
jgi:DNA (cytosine-5)-methyltransferase 1